MYEVCKGLWLTPLHSVSREALEILLAYNYIRVVDNDVVRKCHRFLSDLGNRESFLIDAIHSDASVTRGVCAIGQFLV